MQALSRCRLQRKMGTQMPHQGNITHARLWISIVICIILIFSFHSEQAHDYPRLQMRNVRDKLLNYRWNFNRFHLTAALKGLWTSRSFKFIRESTQVSSLCCLILKLLMGFQSTGERPHACHICPQVCRYRNLARSQLILPLQTFIHQTDLRRHIWGHVSLLTSPSDRSGSYQSSLPTDWRTALQVQSSQLREGLHETIGAQQSREPMPPTVSSTAASVSALCNLASISPR